MSALKDGLRTFALAVVTAMIAISVGCGSDSDSGSDSKSTTKTNDTALSSLAFANARGRDPQLRDVEGRLEELAEADGTKFFVFDNEADPEVTLQNARLMVQKDPQVIVEWSAIADANAAVGAQIKRAGIPCVAMSVAVPGCPLIKQDNALAGADAGRYAAQVAKEKGWTDANTTLLLVNAPDYGPDLNQLITSFYSSYAAAFPEMEQRKPDEITPTTTSIGDDAVIVDGGAELKPSNQAVREVLPRIPKDRHIMVGALLNDESALGTLRALQQAGRDGDALIVSSTAQPFALKQLRDNPAWIADLSVFFEAWPKYVLAMAKALASGANVPAETQAPHVVLTKDNVDQYYNDAGKVIADPPIPKSAEYLREHGLK